MKTARKKVPTAVFPRRRWPLESASKKARHPRKLLRHRGKLLRYRSKLHRYRANLPR